MSDSECLKSWTHFDNLFIDTKRSAAKELIERYYYQLTVGCGEADCSNECCASSSCFRLRGLDSNAAAAHALELFKSRSPLCDESLPKVPRNAQESSIQLGQNNSSEPSSSRAQVLVVGESSNFSEAVIVEQDTSCECSSTAAVAQSISHASQSIASTSGMEPGECSTLTSARENSLDFLTEQRLNEVIDSCYQTGSWAKLIGVIGSIFFEPLSMMQSFLVKHSVGTYGLGDERTSTLFKLGGEPDSRKTIVENEFESQRSSSSSKSLTTMRSCSYLCTSTSEEVSTVDVQSVRRAFKKLFSIPDLPFQSTLISAVHYLSRTVAADLRSFNVFSKYPEFPNIFVLIMEIPALGSLEFLEEAMPQFCKTVGFLPISIQVRLARFWSKFEADQLRILVNRVQQLITVRVIPHHETGTPSSLVHDDDCITGAGCLLKILYYASIVGGVMDPPDVIASEKLTAENWTNSVGFQELLPSSDNIVVSNPPASREQKDKPSINWDDPLAQELGVNPVDCREPLIGAEDFVNEMLSDTIEIDKDYTYYRATVLRNAIPGSSSAKTSLGIKFSYMLHPYLLTTGIKSTGMFFDNRIRMISERRASVVQNIVHGGHAGGAPYLRLRIRRDHIVDDALVNLEMIATENPQDLRKQLFVEFEGEQGIDEGGVSKEFFQLVIEELFNPDIGMFRFIEETQTFWFNPSSFENDAQFTLIGIVLGLAIYNGVILDVRFPIVVYRKLLGKRGRFRDLKSLYPTLAHGLTELLLYEGDVAEAFDQPFCVADVDIFGVPQVHELKPNGDQIIVTNENKEEFVESYADFLLNKSIEKQFSAFHRGFHMVTHESPLRFLFRPDEIELLVCGSKNFDFKALEEAAGYDGGFRADSSTIRNFWEVVHAFTDEQKHSLLQFATGSDRVPVGGFSKLKLIIARNGPDSNRLPTSHTCFNVLLLPDYSSKEKLQERLVKAITNCKGFGML